MRRLLRSLQAREDGTAVLELGLAIPIVFVLLLGLIDLARAYSIKLQLEQVAQRAIEKVMNGQADNTQLTAIKNEAAASAGVATSAVATTAWLECNGTRKASYDDKCSDGQLYRRYLSVKIDKTFSPIFDFRWAGTDAQGNYTITGATSVRVQ